jgi:hypothetical protein
MKQFEIQAETQGNFNKQPCGYSKTDKQNI